MIFKKKEIKKEDNNVLLKFYDLIQKPIITEKGTLLSNNSQVVFSVPIDANKNEITFEHYNDEDGPHLTDSMDEIWFGKNFGLVTDIKFGPDGNLYVVSLMDGVIYRISPEN